MAAEAFVASRRWRNFAWARNTRSPSRAFSRLETPKIFRPPSPSNGQPKNPASSFTVKLETRGGAIYFQHGGWNEGFCAALVAHQDAGYGVAVTINSNHPEFLEEVIRAVGAAYGWDGYEPPVNDPE